MPQPYLVPVRPSTSRRSQSSGMSPSAVTVWSTPLTFSVYVTFSDMASRRGPGRPPSSPWAKAGAGDHLTAPAARIAADGRERAKPALLEHRPGLCTIAGEVRVVTFLSAG